MDWYSQAQQQLQQLNVHHFTAAIESHGITDRDYLQVHFSRFHGIARQWLSHWQGPTPPHVLDIGGHWLHLASLFSDLGCEVTSCDLPDTFELPSVQSLATGRHIKLVCYRDMNAPACLAKVADNSVDVVLFSEIIEHITFNPTNFWREVWRVMRPGARIILTTPNYYSFRDRAWQWGRFLSGMGGGISISEILTTPSYGHHWKEFSKAELVEYFRTLSPDFAIHRSIYCSHDFLQAKRWLRKRVAGLLPQLYLEIDLPEKRQGIVNVV